MHIEKVKKLYFKNLPKKSKRAIIKIFAFNNPHTKTPKTDGVKGRAITKKQIR